MSLTLVTQDELVKLWERLDAIENYLDVVNMPVAKPSGIFDRFVDKKTNETTIREALQHD